VSCRGGAAKRHRLGPGILWLKRLRSWPVRNGSWQTGETLYDFWWNLPRDYMNQFEWDTTAVPKMASCLKIY
jgi:hypothetical protein